MSAGDQLRGSDVEILEGRDGWLFLAAASGVDICDLYLGPGQSRMLDDQGVRAWQTVLRRRRLFFAERGITYLTVIVPDAHWVYPECLPPGESLREQSPYQRIQAGLDEATAAEFLWLAPELIAAKQFGQTYRQTDSHWNDWGAYVGYSATMAALTSRGAAVPLLPPHRLTWKEREDFGALGVKVIPERSERRLVATVEQDPTRLVTSISNEVRDGFMVVEQDADLPSAVIFRDSFMTDAHKFFSQSFRRTVYASHPNSLLHDLVRRERPDVVLSVVSERRLGLPPTEPSPLDFRALFGDISQTNRAAARSQLQARSLLRRGEAREALLANDQTLTLLEEKEPLARVLLHRARCYKDLGSTHTWLETARAAALADPHDGACWHELAQAQLSAGSYLQARRSWQRALDAEPEQTGYWQAALNAAVRNGDEVNAALWARAAGNAHPDDADLWLLASHAWLMTGDLEAAESATRHGVALAPRSLAHRRQLATVLVRRRAWREARDVLAELVRDDPEQPETVEWLARVERALDQTGGRDR